MILHARVLAKHTKCSRHILHRRTTEQHFCTRTACTPVPHSNLTVHQPFPFLFLRDTARHIIVHNAMMLTVKQLLDSVRSLRCTTENTVGKPSPCTNCPHCAWKAAASPGLLHPRDVMHGHVNPSPGCRPGADGLLRGLIRKHLTDASSSAPSSLLELRGSGQGDSLCLCLAMVGRW